MLPEPPCSTIVSDGESIRLVGSEVWSNGTMLAEGLVLDEPTLARALAEQQARVGEALEAFADNTLRHLHDEASALVSGISFPPIATRFRDRHALVIARGPGYKSDLRIVRPYIRDFRPVLVAVDGGADALLEAGLRPDVIVGDFDSISDAALRGKAELLVHAYPDGRAPGAERLRDLGLAFQTVSAPGRSRGSSPRPTRRPCAAGCGSRISPRSATRRPWRPCRLGPADVSWEGLWAEVRRRAAPTHG